MNCAIRVEMAEIPEELRKDIDRIDEIISEGMTRFGVLF